MLQDDIRRKYNMERKYIEYKEENAYITKENEHKML